MPTTMLGTWRNPPLAYVVAELRISPYYSLAAKVPGIQDRLRSTFPRTVEGQELVVDGPKPSAQPIWQLLSADKKHGFQLGTRSISLHATSYDNSADLLSRWAGVLEAIQEANLGAFVERAGLRYIDLIVPSDHRSPAEYLAQQLQGITPEGAIQNGSMWAAAFLVDGTTVNLHTGAPSPADILLPPNFNVMPLQKPQVMISGEQKIKDGEAVGFIDTDSHRDIGKEFDAAQLVDIFAGMQKVASRTFKAALSDLAKKEWT